MALLSQHPFIHCELSKEVTMTTDQLIELAKSQTPSQNSIDNLRKLLEDEVETKTPQEFLNRTYNL